MAIRRMLLLASAIAASAPATEMFSWHSFDVPLNFNKRWQVVLHHRTRSRHEFSYLEQGRGGAILRWGATARLTPFAGYYFQPQQVNPRSWAYGQRMFAGVEAPFRLTGASMLTTRLAAERYFHTGRPTYNRYRTYARVVLGRGKITPYLQNEWLAVNQGFHSVRNSGGLRLRLSEQVVLEAGYLYDIRRTFWGGDRQAIVTGIRFEPQSR